MDRDPTAFTDIHNHLVPDVDDGARHVQDTLDAVERMTLLGIRKIITTPHLDGSLTLDSGALSERLGEISEAYALAAAAVANAFPEVDLRLGHEVMLDTPDVDFSESRIRMAGTRFVLVEWPRLHLPPGTTKVLRRIRDQGYVPVVAHPERYVGIDLATCGNWRDAGALLQVNFGSLEGRYGGEARKMAKRILERGWADYMASDFHARPDRSIYLRETQHDLEAAGGGEAFVIMSLTNPARILRNEMPIPVPPLPPRRGVWARMRRLLDVEAR